MYSEVVHCCSYAMYPKLVPAEVMLRSVDYRDERELSYALRLCFVPIALAIEALHTSIPGRRFVRACIVFGLTSQG